MRRADVERRLAERLTKLRTEKGWSLEALAARTDISRASLSRIERGELSPTASLLGRLCTAYGWTLSRLMADVETQPPNFIAAIEQTEWIDPESGYRRKAVSPPAADLRGELVEVYMPPGAAVAFDTSPVAGLEHHLWMLEGALTVEVEGSAFKLRAGDTLRYKLSGPSRFHGTGKRDARYLVAIIQP
jgi:transcriptional regulator with XRE-family HTH domain